MGVGARRTNFFLLFGCYFVMVAWMWILTFIVGQGCVRVVIDGNGGRGGGGEVVL